jgi:hypothetical protein
MFGILWDKRVKVKKNICGTLIINIAVYGSEENKLIFGDGRQEY